MESSLPNGHLRPKMASEQVTILKMRESPSHCLHRAVAENSLNPVGIKQDVRKTLLPQLFSLTGLNKAKEMLYEVVQIWLNGVAK